MDEQIQNQRNSPAGWVWMTERRADGTEVECCRNPRTGTTVYAIEDMFRDLNGETGQDYPREEPCRIDAGEHLLSTSSRRPQHDSEFQLWILPIEGPQGQPSTSQIPEHEHVDGVAMRRTRRCGLCRQTGHNRRTCRSPPQLSDVPNPVLSLTRPRIRERGLGVRRRPRRCGQCRQTGHDRRTCRSPPQLPDVPNVLE